MTLKVELLILMLLAVAVVWAAPQLEGITLVTLFS
jgi:hypothetical protein